MINPTPLNIPLERMALLGRDAAYYNTYLGPFPDCARIINVAAGVSHFPRAQIAIDPIYGQPVSAIKAAGSEAIEAIERRLGDLTPDETEYVKMLTESLDAFIKHCIVDKTQQCIEASLPWIETDEIKGDIVLCSHFIFTYDLGLYGTMACIENLMQMAPEGRIYPYCADRIPAIAHFMPHLTFEPTPTYLKITHAHEF